MERIWKWWSDYLMYFLNSVMFLAFLEIASSLRKGFKSENITQSNGRETYRRTFYLFIFDFLGNEGFWGFGDKGSTIHGM